MIFQNAKKVVDDMPKNDEKQPDNKKKKTKGISIRYKRKKGERIKGRTQTTFWAGQIHAP